MSYTVCTPMYSSTSSDAIKENQYYVYGHYRESDGSIFYVGVGKGTRCRNYTNRSNWWKSIHKKHGSVVVILASGLSFSESRAKERELISYYKEIGAKICNMTNGGEGGSLFPKSDEVKAKISAGNIGKNKGKKHSKEVVDRMARSRVGRKHTEETKIKMSIAQKGKPKKNPAYNKGAPMSEEQKEKLRKPKTEAHKKKQSEIMKAKWANIPKDKRPKVDNSGVNNPRYDPKVYSFVHKNGETFTGTRLEMKEKNGVDVKRLFFAKPQKHVGGWRLADD